MRSKSGLSPYDAGIMFILNLDQDDGPRYHTPIWAAEVDALSQRLPVRMLAHQFGYSARDVARDLIERAYLLKTGDSMP